MMNSETIYVNKHMEVVNGERQYYGFLGGERVATLTEVMEYPACDLVPGTLESPVTWTPTVSCLYNGSSVTTIPYTTVGLPGGAVVLAQEGGKMLIKLSTPTLRTVYHHTDHLTGASLETDPTGTVVQSLSYHPYGSERVNDQAGRYRSIHTYTDKERDFDTGLFDYGARYYDPVLKRFLQQDPWAGTLADPQSTNEYAYVRNNPIRYIDPTGNAYETVWDIANIAVDAAMATYHAGQLAADGMIYGAGAITGNEALQQVGAEGAMESTAALGNDAVNAAADVVATAIPFVPAGMTKVDDAAKIGKHILQQGIESLQKSIKSFEKNVAEHKDKIANPDKYINPSEIRGDAAKYREGLIEKWKKDLERNQADLDASRRRLEELQKQAQEQSNS